MPVFGGISQSHAVSIPMIRFWGWTQNVCTFERVVVLCALGCVCLRFPLVTVLESTLLCVSGSYRVLILLCVAGHTGCLCLSAAGPLCVTSMDRLTHLLWWLGCGLWQAPQLLPKCRALHPYPRDQHSMLLGFQFVTWLWRECPVPWLV